MQYFENRRDNQHKAFATVLAEHRPDGMIIPRRFKLEDGKARTIDRVVDVTPAPALKAGGQGIRYTCMIEGKQYYLFHDRKWWFFELSDNMQLIEVE